MEVPTMETNFRRRERLRGALLCRILLGEYSQYLTSYSADRILHCLWWSGVFPSSILTSTVSKITILNCGPATAEFGGPKYENAKTGCLHTTVHFLSRKTRSKSSQTGQCFSQWTVL